MSIFNPLDTQELANPLVEIYKAIEDALLLSIAERLAKNLEITDTAKWEMKMLAQMGALRKDSIKIIASHIKSVPDMLNDTIKSAAEQAIDLLEPGFKKLAKDGYAKNTRIPPSRSVQRAVGAYYDQALDSLNMVNTVMQYKVKPAWTTLVKGIRKYIDQDIDRQGTLNTLNKHTGAVVIGAETRQKAVRKAINEMLDNGIPAFVDKAGREWSPEAYVNMDIRTTVSNTAHQAQFNRMDDYGLNLIAISSHAGSRPKCAKDQGKIFDKNNSSGEAEDLRGRKIRYYPWSSSSYGEPDGILGINCGHKATPFIPGLSMQRYFPTEDMEENDRKYQQKQKQRELERRVRRSKLECAAYEELGDDEAFKKAAKTLKNRQQTLKQYCSDNGLTYRSDRTSVVRYNKGISRKVALVEREDKLSPFAKIANTENFPITDDRIDRIPVPTCKSLTVEQNKLLHSQCRDLLKSVQNKEIGTEAGMTLDMKGKMLHHKIGKLGAEKIYMKPESKPYIFLHNHPDGNVFSAEDIQQFIKHNNMQIMVAVGNDGSLYLVEKLKEYDETGLILHFRDIIENNPDIMNSPQDYVNTMEFFLKGATDYGIKVSI